MTRGVNAIDLLSGEITQLLSRVRAGDRDAEARLMLLVYDELRRLTAHYLRQPRGSPAVPSLQFRVFRLGLLEDGDVRVGVLPKGEEVLVGRAGFGKGIGLERPLWAPCLGGHKACPYTRL